MKVLIDSDVLLDIALNRRPFVDESVLAFDALIKQSAQVYYTPIILANIIYIVQKHKNRIVAQRFMQYALELGDVLPVSKSTFLDSFKLNRNDLEDGIQLQAAIQNEVSLILTRNKRDYRNKQIPALSPEEYLFEFG